MIYKKIQEKKLKIKSGKKITYVNKVLTNFNYI